MRHVKNVFERTDMEFRNVRTEDTSLKAKVRNILKIDFSVFQRAL